jgi:hypothetical protein
MELLFSFNSILDTINKKGKILKNVLNVE